MPRAANQRAGAKFNMRAWGEGLEWWKQMKSVIALMIERAKETVITWKDRKRKMSVMESWNVVLGKTGGLEINQNSKRGGSRDKLEEARTRSKLRSQRWGRVGQDVEKCRKPR